MHSVILGTATPVNLRFASNVVVTVVAGLHLMFAIVKMWGPNKRLNDKNLHIFSHKVSDMW